MLLQDEEEGWRWGVCIPAASLDGAAGPWDARSWCGVTWVEVCMWGWEGDGFWVTLSSVAWSSCWGTVRGQVDPHPETLGVSVGLGRGVGVKQSPCCAAEDLSQDLLRVVGEGKTLPCRRDKERRAHS